MKRFSKLFVTGFISLFLLFGTSSSVFPAQQPEEATPGSEVGKPVDPYVLFWPLVAGKTSADTLYLLKSLKEKVIGLFIFERGKKAEYQVTLSTKRLLETEKLADLKKSGKALETIKRAKSHIERAISLSGKDGLESVRSEMGKKLKNLEIFLPYLKNKTEDNSDVVLDEINSRIKELQSKP